jgi:tetratricopeptide (TPR) repeat protein
MVTTRLAVVILVSIWSLAAMAEGKPDTAESQPVSAESQPASAESQPASAERGAEARAAYLRAREHYDAGRYDEAVTELKRAYSLMPLGTLLRYLGDCYYAMKRYPLALKYYQLYFKRARYAPDKAEVGRRVRELEESLSVDEEGSPTVERKRAKLPPDLLPTGRDAEIPSDLLPASLPADEPAVPPAPPPTDSDSGWRGRILRYSKWSALGVGVAALALGVTFHVLAGSKAQELEDHVRNACPASSPDCGGNPDLADPVSIYTLEQYDLERTYLRYQNRAVGFYVAGGVAAAAAVVLFVLDRPRRRPAGQLRTVVVPDIGLGRVGFAGEVRF